VACGTYRKDSFQAVRQDSGEVHLLIRDSKDETVVLAGATLTRDEFTDMLSHVPARVQGSIAAEELSEPNPPVVHEIIITDDIAMESNP